MMQRTRTTRLMAVFLLLGLVAGNASSAWGQNPNNADEREPYNIFLQAPRNLRQNLSRAQKALEEQRFSDAVTELGEILNSQSSDDYFLDPADGSDTQISLKARAQQLLGSMPAKGRQLYELQFGAEARTLLDRALEEGSVQLLTDVARRYFHTKAGYEATLLLGRWQLDQGRPLAAALTLKRIADTPAARANYDPELSVLLATCWNHARLPERARETLVQLHQRLPQAKVQLSGKEVALFTSDEQALTWLEKIVGAGGAAKTFEATQWVMFRGNETRNASTSASFPLLNYRWNLPTVNDPQDEARVKAQTKAQLDRGEPVVSSVQPLAVNDTVLIRTPDRIVGVDLHTGKRIWVFPWDDDSYEREARKAPPRARNQAVDQRTNELRQRLWEDHCFGQMSSDGGQVFLIDELGYASAPSYGASIRMMAGRPVVNGNFGRTYNKLVALDLKKQGKLNWIVGGESGEDDAGLAGAFFLGAPLPMEGQLYVLAEFNGEIRLCCLNAKTGALEWKQQVALMEDSQQIMFDNLRRLAGATPSFADGVLVCPTSGGAVVAIDRTTRSLLWGYQYSRWDAVAQRVPGAFGFQSYSRTTTPTTHWLDSSATIANGSVLLTPVESSELHCLDLVTGKPRWPAQPRGDMLYVACVHGGQAILVGKNQLKAINLADGKEGWVCALEQSGDLPSGRGYYSDNFYFLPTMGKELLKIDLDAGKVVARAKTAITLGNLVCYKDEIISQGSDWVAAFYQSEPLRERVAIALKQNPNDIEALTRQGEILLQEGARKESLDSLWKAHRLAPENEATRAMLVKVVLLLLKDDYVAHREMAVEIEKLIDQPAQRRELLRLQAQGLEQAGETWSAFQAYTALGKASLFATPAMGPSELEPIDRDRNVRASRFLQGRLQGLFAGADSALQAKMTAEIQTRLSTVLATDTAAALRQFNEHYGFHPLAAQARLALVAKLIAADQLLEAEMLAGQLVASSEPAIAGGALAALAQVYEKAQRLDLAVNRYVELGQKYADTVCQNGLTGRELAAKGLAGEALRGELAQQTWPAGRVEVQAEKATDDSDRPPALPRISYGIPVTEFAGVASRGLRAGYDPNGPALTLRDDHGRSLVSASLNTIGNQTRRIYSMPYTSLSAKVNGHLLIVNMGTELVAIDGLRSGRVSGEGLIWREETVDLDPNSRSGIYPQQKTITTPLTGSRQIYYDPQGRLSFATGPITLAGICYQKARQIICVDPLTGQALWEHGGFEPSCDIFGDEELIFVVAPNSDEAHVLSAIDGSLLGKRPVPRADRRWTTAGRRVLSWEQNGATLNVRLADIWQTGKAGELWNIQVPYGSKGCLIAGEEVGLLTPAGKLTIVSLADGKEQLAANLEPETTLHWLSVQKSRERYLVIANGPPLDAPEMMVQPIANGMASLGIVNGRVYSFDPATGKSQWPVPAYIAQHGYPADQPVESPLLFFVRNLNNARGSSKWRSSVLAIDKRDGRIVLDEDNLTPTSAGLANSCEVVADPEQKTVTLSIFTPQVKVIVLRYTGQPQPPAPPAQTGKLSSLNVGKPDGIVDSAIGAVIRAMSGPKPRFVRPAPPDPAR